MKRVQIYLGALGAVLALLSPVQAAVPETTLPEIVAPAPEEPLIIDNRAASFVSIPSLSKSDSPLKPEVKGKKLAIKDVKKVAKKEEPKKAAEPTKAEIKAKPIKKLGDVNLTPEAVFSVQELIKIEEPIKVAPKKPSVEVMVPAAATAVTSRKAPLRDSRRKRIIIGGSVDRAPIAEINSDSFGVLSDANGGLGADMWNGTSRRMIDRVMPALELPVPSPVLNDLARRFLLTTAAVPDDRQQAIRPLPDMTSMRVEKLLSLGAVTPAWGLANMVKKGKLDEITLRRLSHMALLKNKDESICPSIPRLIAAYSAGGKTASEWQKTQIFCQMKQDNQKAVALGLDLMREQKIKDDPFMHLVGRNYLKKWKTLPKNMMPLRSIDLAVMRFLGKELPKAFYKRPSAANVPELLKGDAQSNWWKLNLAEREALRGQITSAQLADVYKGIPFKGKDFAKPLMAKKKGATARALYYQTALKQTNVSARLQLVMKFLDTVNDRDLSGSVGLVLAELAQGIPVSEEYGIFAAQGARLFALAGDPDRAMKWRALAQRLAVNFAEVGVQLAARWPVFVFSGLESDGDYAQGMADWLFVSLVPGTPTQERQRRDYAGQILLLLSAAGYAVPEEAWLRVTEAPPLKTGVITSALLLERLGFVSRAERKGEAVLLSLLLAGSEGQDTSLAAQMGIVRALRLVGLNAEAQLVAREAVASIKIP